MPETVVHFQLRMPPGLHEKLATYAKTHRVSLNALIVSLLDRPIVQDAASTESIAEIETVGSVETSHHLA